MKMDENWRERTLEHLERTVQVQHAVLDYVRDSVESPRIKGVLDALHYSPRPDAPTPYLNAFSEANGFLTSESNTETDAELIELFTDVLFPLAGIPVSDDEVVDCKFQGNDDPTSAKAISYFSKAVTQVHYGIQGAQSEMTVYHTPDQKPVLLQLSNEIQSAITLVPLRIRNVVYPPGLFAGVTVKHSRPDYTGEHLLKHVGYLTAKIESASIHPRSFSPWAYNDPRDRSLFGVDPSMRTGFDGKRARMARERTLGDFGKAAIHIMGMCKPDPEPARPLGLEKNAN